MEILNIQSSLLYVSVLCVRYGNYPPEATCGYSCKHKKTLEEDPSAFAFDEVYDDMKHRDIVPKLQDRQHLKDLVKGFQHSAPYCECRACSNSPNLSRAGGREQRRQYGGTQDWYVSGQDLRWLHLLTTTTAATSVKRDAAVVQAGGGVVVVRCRCGRD
ncbi:hypothetical protein Bca101_099350 [Brassica carinata]